MNKKIGIWIYPLIVMGFVLILTNGCEKEKETIPVPVLTTSAINYISPTAVTCGGNITSDGGATVNARGVCWSTGHTPTVADSITTDGTGPGSFISAINGLSTNTTYYMRAYATNSGGTGYGNEISFRTWHTETVTDFDGNVYHIVTIGAQDWLVENLKVTHYRNGDPIPNISDNMQWENLTAGAYCNYDNAQSNSTTYGRLYNWHAINDSRNIAPTGWHVSSDAEWTVLTTYLGGEAIAGSKLKETGTTHWLAPNSEATNETGFTGLPGGGRSYNGTFDYIAWGGAWWTSTPENDYDAWIRYLDHGSFDVWRYVDGKLYGRSVRCVKD